jgi:ribulose-5-phosphate 4-epimerase/fuculose-1-phosphate aldolase
VLDEQEGIDISKALGNKKAAILSNHGLLTTGATVEAAVFWFISLEKCCQAQLMADAAAAGRGSQTVKINEEDAAYTYKSLGSPLAGWFSALPEFDVMLAEHGDEILS